MPVGRGPSGTAARTRRNSIPAVADLTNPEQAWKLLYETSVKMLISYKEVLTYYAKWVDFTGQVLWSLDHYTSGREWSALDVLVEIEKQKEHLTRLGATQDFFQVAKQLEHDTDREPTLPAEREAFVERVERFIEALVLKNPRKDFPVEAMGNRLRIRGKFSGLRTKTKALAEEVKLYCFIYVNPRKIRDLEARDLPSEPIDETPAATRNTWNTRMTPRAERAQWRALKKEMQDQGMAPSLEDSARPKQRPTLTRGTFTSPVASGSRAGHALEDAEVQSFNLEEAGEIEGLPGNGVDGRDAGGGQATGGAAIEPKTPSPSPSEGSSDGSTVCLTPAPVKGLKRASTPTGTLRDSAARRRPPDTPKEVVDGSIIDQPMVGDGRNNEELLDLEAQTFRGTTRRRSRTPEEEEANHHESDSPGESGRGEDGQD